MAQIANPANPTTKTSLGLCTESHGSENVHTYQACSVCEKRVCALHLTQHIVDHIQLLRNGLKAIVENTKDDTTKSYAQAVLDAK
jgi:hypothetical protein